MILKQSRHYPNKMQSLKISTPFLQSSLAVIPIKHSNIVGTCNIYYINYPYYVRTFLPPLVVVFCQEMEL